MALFYLLFFSHYNSINKYIRDNEAAGLELVFAIDDEVFGEKKCIELSDNGKEREVTNENKEEYIDALIEWKFTKRIEPQMEVREHLYINLF